MAEQASSVPGDASSTSHRFFTISERSDRSSLYVFAQPPPPAPKILSLFLFYLIDCFVCRSDNRSLDCSEESPQKTRKRTINPNNPVKKLVSFLRLPNLCVFELKCFVLICYRFSLFCLFRKEKSFQNTASANSVESNYSTRKKRIAQTKSKPHTKLQVELYFLVMVELRTTSIVSIFYRDYFFTLQAVTKKVSSVSEVKKKLKTGKHWISTLFMRQPRSNF